MMMIDEDRQPMPSQQPRRHAAVDRVDADRTPGVVERVGGHAEARSPKATSRIDPTTPKSDPAELRVGGIRPVWPRALLSKCRQEHRQQTSDDSLRRQPYALYGRI